MNKNKNYKLYGLIAYYIIKFLSLTLKVRIIENGHDIRKAHIYGFWHNKLIAPTIFFRKIEKKVALSSPAKDGELISVPLEKLGYVVVRGSSDKESVSSTIKLLKYIKKGYTMGTPLDGPKGPREKAKKGLLYLAQKTKTPLIPLGVYYEKKWILKKTWDKFEIPKPFSTINIILGEEIIIDSKKDIDEYIELVERKMKEESEKAKNLKGDKNV